MRVELPEIEDSQTEEAIAWMGIQALNIYKTKLFIRR